MHRFALLGLVVIGCVVVFMPDARAAGGAGDGLAPLAVPGFGDAVVSPPRRSWVGPEPVMIVAHGHGCDPEDICRVWRGVVGDAGFLVCPRGVPVARGGYGFDARFPAEVDADVAALRARWGLRVAPGPMVYSGYSQGAYEGPGFVMKNPALYPRVLLDEGGQQGWDARRFAANGGQRVLFACGQETCDVGARAAVGVFERSGVPAKAVYAPGAGHVYGGAVADAIEREWAWLVAGDPRWGVAPVWSPPSLPLPPAWSAPWWNGAGWPFSQR